MGIKLLEPLTHMQSYIYQTLRFSPLSVVVVGGGGGGGCVAVISVNGSVQLTGL